jgi:hypothetical protein
VIVMHEERPIEAGSFEVTMQHRGRPKGQQQPGYA